VRRGSPQHPLPLQRRLRQLAPPLCKPSIGAELQTGRCCPGGLLRGGAGGGIAARPYGEHGGIAALSTGSAERSFPGFWMPFFKNGFIPPKGIKRAWVAATPGERCWWLPRSWRRPGGDTEPHLRSLAWTDRGLLMMYGPLFSTASVASLGLLPSARTSWKKKQQQIWQRLSAGTKQSGVTSEHRVARGSSAPAGKRGTAPALWPEEGEERESAGLLSGDYLGGISRLLLGIIREWWRSIKSACGSFFASQTPVTLGRRCDGGDIASRFIK